MNYSINPSADGKYIVVTVTGEINRNNAMKQNLVAHEIGKKMGLNRYLVDVTQARNTDTITSNYNYAYSDMQRTESIDKTARVSLLVDPEDHSHDFIEIVSKNAGLNVTLFTDPDEAIRHLLAE